MSTQQKIKKDTRFGIFHIAWLITFFGIPFGIGIPGLLLLLLSIPFAFSEWKRFFLSWTQDKRFFVYIAFLILIFIGSLASESGPISILSFVLLIFGLFAVMTSAAWLLENQTYFKRVLMPTLAIGTTLSGTYALWTYFVLGARRAHTVGVGVNGITTVLLLSLCLLFVFAFNTKGKYRALLIIPFILSFLSIIFSYSRGGWLGIISFPIAFSILSNKYRKHIIGLCTVCIIVVALIISFEPGLQSRAETMFSLSDNTDRLRIWDRTIIMIRDNPLVGIGIGGFNYYDEKHFHAGAAYSHNFFLQFLAEFGIIGGLIFFYLYGDLLWRGYKGTNRADLLIPHGFVAALMVLLVREQVDNTIYDTNIWVGFWMVWGYLRYFLHCKELDSNAENRERAGFGNS